MADGKWISGLTRDTSVEDAARKTLNARLGVVQQYLPLALRAAEKDIEYVHQLRVGSRRSVAALTIFEACLPPKAHRRIFKKLKRVRKAAGGARDWDVFLKDLTERTTRGIRSEFLLGYARGQRDVAQENLGELEDEFPHGFEIFVEESLSQIQAPDGKDAPAALGELADSLLERLIAQLHAAANQNLDDFDHLHKVRILGKQVRYAMEVVADCYGPPLHEQLYPAIEEMQDILGRANDSHVGAHRLQALREAMRAAQPTAWKRVAKEVESLLRSHQRRLPQERKRFLAWWQRWEGLRPEEFIRQNQLST